MLEKKKRIISTTQMIILSFLTAILIGAILLMLPVSAADGRGTPFMDALFTATTSVCVTGLVTVTTATHWSLFGKIVILCLIQVGGIGVAAIAMLLFIFLGRKVSIGYRKLLGDSFNLNTMEGLVRFLKKVVIGTLFVETLGALGYMPVFIREYGVGKGIWFSVFHSISAFCNAGLDLLGENSLMNYVHNTWFNIVTMFLIIAGGIGFIVWWDIINVFRCRTSREYQNIAKVKNLSLHSKIVLCMSATLILGGAFFYFIFEYHNDATIGSFTLYEKILACLFQSVTTRTAGFAAISQKGLTAPSVMITVVLMLIGGSSGGTAGGVKTGTIAVLLIAVISTVRGQDDMTVFKRRLPISTVKKALSVVSISLLLSFVVLILMYVFVDGSAIDILYEVYSAIGTVGLSRDFTGSMNLIGKCIICACMFFGRIGPMSMVLAFTLRNKNSMSRFIEEDVTVG